MKRLCIIAALMVLLTGCGVNKSSLYPGTGATADLREEGVQVLGEVTACQGAWCKKDGGGYEWPVSISHPPPALTYQKALRQKAAKQYGIPEGEVVLGEVSVGYHTEMIGTIRGWEATAVAGRKVSRTSVRDVPGMANQ
jgi:hypothetical protein